MMDWRSEVGSGNSVEEGKVGDGVNKGGGEEDGRGQNKGDEVRDRFW